MKRVISLLAAVMLIVLLAACGGGTSAPRTLRIGVALYQQDDTFISSVARELQRAAQEAQTRQSAPTLHTDHSVQQAVSGAEEQARQHMPQAPTMSGGVYPVYDGQAAAQAKKEE